MDAMAASHRSRLSNTDSRTSIDDRTWQDLDLDAVFATVDRTESTLGQHALYHRLRTAPLGDHLDAFEALVTTFGHDVNTRERAQLALMRLQDPHGYDVWWLAAPDAVEPRAWYRVFPLLTLLPIAALSLTPVWPPAWAVFIGLVLLNVAAMCATPSAS